MKYIVITLALLMTFEVSATELCAKNVDTIGAKYELIKNNDQKQVMNLWRTNKQVAHEYIDRNMTELWQKLNNGELRLVRYFDRDQQAIEYQPSEVSYQSADNQWQQMQHMISNDVLKKMNLINKTGHGCDTVITYELATETQNLTVEWMPELHLIKSLTDIANGDKTQWKLVKLVEDKTEINQAFSTREQYRATDYADIGDNESDPFLQKMIAMGYINHGPSGFYDADGHDIGDKHSH